MDRKRMLVLLAALLIVFAPAARGAGFLIYEHGAAAQAMAGAFTSIANNPSAIWHNPAGLAWVEGTQVMLGGTFIIPVGSVLLPNYPGSPKINQKNQLFFPPNFYFSHKFNDRVTAGIGVFFPFGLGTSWPNAANDFPLRYIGTRNDMTTVFVNPTVAFKVTDNFSVGVGLSYIYSTLELDLVEASTQLSELLPAFDIPAALNAHGSSLGWNAGLLYRGKGFSLGMNYRSRFNIKYKGDLTLDNGNAPPEVRDLVPTSGTAATTFKFPDIMTFGISFNLTPKLLWSVDLHTYWWKRYDQYTISLTFPSPVVPALEQIALTNWKTSICARTGFQYQATDKLALRAGVFYDQAPQPTATMDSNLPDADRVAVTAGFGYKFGKLMLDVGYHFETFQKRTDTNTYVFGVSPNAWTGTYKTQAHLIGISLGYKF